MDATVRASAVSPAESGQPSRHHQPPLQKLTLILAVVWYGGMQKWYELVLISIGY